MTQEEFYKSNICAAVYRKTRQENFQLRQIIAGKDPASLKQEQEDREAFALVKARRERMPEMPKMEIRQRETPAVLAVGWAQEEEPEDRNALDTASVFLTWAAAIGVMLLPLLAFLW